MQITILFLSVWDLFFVTWNFLTEGKSLRLKKKGLLISQETFRVNDGARTHDPRYHKPML